MAEDSRIDQRKQKVGTQTNIAGNATGPMISGVQGDVIYIADEGLTKSIPKQSKIIEKTQIKKLEKIKELEERRLICHDAACTLQVKISLEILSYMDSEADSSKK